MIQIPVDELFESLKIGYIEYKECVAAGSDAVDLAHVKAYCTTIEQILSAYGNIPKEQMLEIKRPIIGDISLRRGKKKDMSINYDVPTIFRNQFEKKE